MLELILGPMYSGKTTALLQRTSGNTLVVNHSFDTRTGNSIRSHDGVEAPAVKCTHIRDLPRTYDTVLVDEAQFFEDLEGVEDLAPHVVVAGLSGDYLRRPFGKILDLIPKADKVTFLQAVCACGAPARFTQRVSAEDDLVSVSSRYLPACEKCWKCVERVSKNKCGETTK